MSIDERLDRLTERHEALTMNGELISKDIETLTIIAARDGENIRALSRIAEMHERRVTELEGGDEY